MAAHFAAMVLAAVTGTGLATVRLDAPPPVDFAVRTGHGVERLSDLRGRPVVINFWATWCHACTEEMKYFVRAKQTYGDKIEVVTVSDELPDVAASYFRVWNVDLPVVEDPSGTIFKGFSVHPIPVTLVLDAEGNVSYVSVGGLSWQELDEAIRRASEPAGDEASSRTPRVLP